MDCVSHELFFWTIGGVLALIGVVWRDHNDRHAKVSDRCDGHDRRFLTYDKLDADISAIRTDIEWIKRSLQEIKK